MECLKLIASPHFYEKRIGYLGLSLLLTEHEEVLTLVTNSIKLDLQNPSPFVVGLALSAVGNLATEDIARDLAMDVDKVRIKNETHRCLFWPYQAAYMLGRWREKFKSMTMSSALGLVSAPWLQHLRSSNSYLRKKAALTTVRIFKRVPELVEEFSERITSLLKDRSHGVLITGVQLMIEVIRLDEAHAATFVRLVPSLVRLLRNLLTMGYAPDYDVAGITDPFLQVGWQACVHRNASRPLRVMGCPLEQFGFQALRLANVHGYQQYI
jgi:AP-1 complex subunit gamma-1